MSRVAFRKLWLDTDTFICGLTAAQRREVRLLCEKFFKGGCKHEATRKPKSTPQSDK